MWVLTALLMLVGISKIKAQDIPTFLKIDNQFIQQRIEKSDPEGWLYFKQSAGLGEGDLFKLYKSAAGLSEKDSMHLIESTKDDQGYTHNRYQQYYKSIKVEDAEFFEHIKDCKVELMHGKVIEQLKDEGTFEYTEQQALNAALSFLGASQYSWENTTWEQALKDDTGDANATYYPIGELVFAYPFEVDMVTSNYKLAWKFEILAISPFIHKTIYVNANTGAIIKSYDMRENNGPAVTLYDGTQTIDTKWFGGIFHGHHHLESDDAGKKIKTRHGSTLIINPATLVAMPFSWADYEHSFDSDDVWAIDRANETSAHWGVNRAWDYFKTTFGRNGMNNSGSEVRIFASSVAPVGAQYFFLDGKDYLEFATSFYSGGTTNFASLDVCGHEFTHGIVRNEANFGIAGEPGALNESFADIFGTLVEHFQRGGAINWTIAEDVLTLRDMQNPNAFGDAAIYLTDPLWIPTVGCTPGAINDRCGIHSNCGVQNRWFFLLTQGDTENGTVQGIGSSSAARIAYSNLCNFLGSASGYPEARLGSIAAARQIFGPCSNEEIQTTNAWAAVGVGAPFAGPCLFGSNELCGDLIFNETFTAMGVPGATFTWTIPPGWTTHTTGTGNQTLVVTGIPVYPYYPVTTAIEVMSSLGGTTTIWVTVEDCKVGDTRNCTEKEVDARGKTQKGSTSISTDIALYPNPVKDWINIQSNGQKVEKIKIYDVTGELIHVQNTSSNSQISVDVTGFNAGTYFLSIQLDKEAITKRFIKID